MGMQQAPQRPKRSPWVFYGPIIAIVVVVIIVAVVIGVGGSDDNKKSDNSNNNATTGGVVTQSGTNGVPLFYTDAKAKGEVDKHTWMDNCDTSTGRVAIPIIDPPPCTEKLPSGGASSPGVTADTIKIGYYIAKPDPIFDQLAKQAGAYDPPENTEKAFKQYIQTYGSVYNLYGRKIELVKIQGTGTSSDAVAARADADRAAAAGVFAVLGGPGQAKQFGDELAQKKILCVGTCILAQPEKYYLDNAPYMWPTGPAPDQTSTMVSELIKSQLIGKPAQWAGGDLQGKPRTFTLLTYDTPDGQFKASWDDLEQKVKGTGANMLAHVNYYLNLPTLQADAQTTALNLKQKGATTLIFTGDPIFPQYLTKEMTKLNYFPEWVMSGTVLADTNVFARQFDQKQWVHAFGLQLIPARLPKDKQDAYTVNQWYWGTPPATENNYGIIKGDVELLMNGLQLAGPNLTPQAFKNGMDANGPASSTTEPILNTIDTYGQHGIWPNTPDDPGGLDNAGLMFWDPTANGPDETGTVANGMYRFMSGGVRYLPGKWPTSPLPIFDNANTVTIYGENDIPPSLLPKEQPKPPGAPSGG
jgi:hypothetical protein